MHLQCVILAGGRGVRMASYTADLPKALIPVSGKPFIDYQLAQLARTGVSDVLLCIGYKGDQIREHVQDGTAWGLRVRYADEGPALQGTAGALRVSLEAALLDPGFLLTYGDSFLPIDFSGVWRYFESRSEPILMTVFKNAGQWEPSNAIFDGSKVLYDKKPGAAKDTKMQFLDYGLLAMRRTVETDVPDGPSDLADLVKTRSLKGDVAGMEIAARFYEIGSPEGLKNLTHYLEQQGGHS